MYLYKSLFSSVNKSVQLSGYLAETTKGNLVPRMIEMIVFWVPLHRRTHYAQPPSILAPQYQS